MLTEEEALLARAAEIFSGAKQASIACDAPPELLSLASIDPARIPHLRWVVQDFLLAGEIALLGGMGGVGKSLFGWNVAASVAAGVKFAWFEQPSAPRPVIILSGEDDNNEVARRVAAFCSCHGLDYADLGQRIFIHPSTDIRLAVKEGSVAKATGLAEAVRHQVVERGAGLLVIDPLIKTGAGFDENSNGDMEALFGIVRGLVADTDCAGLVLDHFAKSGDGSSQNAIRGASAKVNASRCTVTLSLMPEKDYLRLKHAGIGTPRERLPVFMHPKSNYGRRSGPHVFQLIDYPVGNGETKPVYAQHDPEMVPATWTHREDFMELAAEKRWLTSETGPRANRLDAAMSERFGIDLRTAREWLLAFEADGAIVREQGKDDNRKAHEYWVPKLPDDA